MIHHTYVSRYWKYWYTGFRNKNPSAFSTIIIRSHKTAQLEKFLPLIALIINGILIRFLTYYVTFQIIHCALPTLLSHNFSHFTDSKIKNCTPCINLHYYLVVDALFFRPTRLFSAYYHTPSKVKQKVLPRHTVDNELN